MFSPCRSTIPAARRQAIRPRLRELVDGLHGRSPETQGRQCSLAVTCLLGVARDERVEKSAIRNWLRRAKERGITETKWKETV